jgi:hypothetical protein
MLLATAGGPGDGLELVCFGCGTYLALIAAFVIAIIAMVRCSVWLLVLSLLLVAFAGAIVLEAHLATQESRPPTDDGDEIAARRYMDELVPHIVRVWYVGATSVGTIVVTAVSTMVVSFLIIRRNIKRRQGTAIAEPAPSPESAGGSDSGAPSSPRDPRS